jgi:ribonuclease E
MKRMLFNATQAEELRVAIVDGQKLVDLDIEHVGQEQRKSNIYKAKVTRVEQSLEAIFVDYGAERHGFLPFKELTREYVQGEDGDGTRAKLAQNLKVGQEILVQVEKDERGNKGAALTTYVSLAGRYLVLMPNNPRGGGVSRRVEGEDRAELRETLDSLDIPAGMSVIARTAGIGRSAEELQWDLSYLMQLWEAIEGAGRDVKAPELIYLESSLVVRAIRDLFQPDIGEILIDTPEIFEQAQSFMSTVMPANVGKVKLYTDDVPLFSRFQIEHQIETAYRRDVQLPSGGAIVIDHTEALVSVDVNSARATRGHDIEDTAFRTNCEAADEIARQLRLRDLGGLVVIDFIDMESPKNQREVENRLRDALHHDRARVQTGKISRFGLLELSRQRLQPALSESSYIPCPRCHGIGHIRGTSSSALHILRIIQEESMKENTAAIHAQVPVDVATFLLNEKRQDVHAIETRFKVNVLLIPNVHLETPNYEIERLRHDSEKLDVITPSYQMAAKPTEDSNAKAAAAAPEVKATRAVPVVKGITPDQPAPMAAEPVSREQRAAANQAAQTKAAANTATPSASLWQRVARFFGGDAAPQPIAPQRPEGGGERSKDAAKDGGREQNRDRSRRDGGKDGGRDGKRGRPGQGPQVANQGQNRAPRGQQGRDPNRDAAAGIPEAKALEANAARPQREPREPRQPREARENREPRDFNAQGQAPQPRQQSATKPALEARPVVEQTEEGESRGRRRRGRGGRERIGERVERAPRADGSTEIAAASTEDAKVMSNENHAQASAAPPAATAAPAVSTPSFLMADPAPAAIPKLMAAPIQAVEPLPVVAERNIAVTYENSHKTTSEATPAAAPADTAIPAEAARQVELSVTASATAPIVAPVVPKPAVMASVQPALAFGNVDQIGESESIRTEPRRRPRPVQGTNAQVNEPLVFIETAADKAQQTVLVEEEAPRRRTPRERKPRETFSEPLSVVETQSNQSPPNQT